MPYTPPSHSRSPANSAPSSPDVSRRPSFQSGPRPALPRSSSYLSKHRRTPSAVGGGHHDTPDEPTPPGTSEDLKGMATSVSVRQSPPPITDARGMPNGAVISPPDSATASEEEDNNVVRGRQLENLKELKAAINKIPVQRSSSPPTAKQPTAVTLKIPRSEDGGIIHSFSTTTLELAASRRRTHTRSATESHLMISQSAENSVTASEEDSDEDMLKKPPMVRKKSGELVRPALRPPSRRRPSSMPGTPTFSKAVHFDSHLEHVRHFLQVDRPLAVSAGSSPVDNYDSDTEYPFPADERSGTRSPPYEWEIVTANYAPDSPIRTAQPVRLEKVWLSPDQKSLIGSACVANLAFQKSVVCRFTLDYWKTTSEVAAEYSHELRPAAADVSTDRFIFNIKLSDLAHLESKTLFFCIKYNVIGQDFWDNNNGTNFQVDFRKKYLPQNGKRGLQGNASRPVGGLPRSSRRSSPANSTRPKSMPVELDEFGGDQPKLNFEQPLHEYLGESGTTGLRFKTKSAGNLASDNLSKSLSAPSGQAFSNRYDFGASLSAAVQAAKDTITKDRNSDGLYMKSHKKISMAPEVRKQPKLPVAASDLTPAPRVAPVARVVPTVPVAPAAPVAPVARAAPVSLPTQAAGTSSPNSSLASSSYEELVNKYCFFGSKQTSPQLRDGSLKNTRFDGPSDGSVTRGTNSTSSSTNSSPRQPQHAGAAQHHTMHFQYVNPYFDVHAVGGSPVGSPLKTLIASATDGQSSQATTPSTIKSATPTPLAGGGLGHFAGTSPHDPWVHHQARFPFSSTEAHMATAIRG
ncbi:putative phosphatase regulatory subunit-domain-containing protein [Plectosphaerella cucumerina]|uniref:Phosphatase regulatory subunit-domain-containing protein n=1 Tax=Plectosphaerella cucumerina TaxID=40658 RepID=A0A8K0TQ20_9PEZI|nr:putative phosphatase regulatory subunit-domain-containing protein [Plectosphaerella cucumerina]